MRYREWLLCGCTGVVVLSTSYAAIAQTAAPAAATTGIEEIVVSAQKRAQKSQDVPVSMSAISAAQISDLAIQNIAEISSLAIGLNITGTGGAVTPFLRGVGNDASTVGNEASVAVYLDDVYQPRLNPALLELNDIDRIEVLKGPQGTLFGRNSSGGLISVYTRDPTHTPTGELTLGYGNYDTQTAKLYVSGGITDNLTADLSALHSYQGDGWGRNIETGLKVGYENYDLVRSKWILTLPDDTRIRLIGDYGRSKGDSGINDTLYPGATGGFYAFDAPSPGAIRRPVGFYDADSYYQHLGVDQSSSVQARIDHDFRIATLASITSFRNAYENVWTSGTGATVSDLNYDLVTYDRTFTQEFQLSSEAGSPVDWIVGLYYLNAFAGYQPTNVSGNGLGPVTLGGALGPCTGCQVNLIGEQRIKDYSGYAQATGHILDDTNVTLGIRYTVDDLWGYGRTDAVVPGLGTITFPGTLTTGHDFYKPTYKIGLDHHFSSDVMSYITYSRGFKSGTYNTLPLGATPAAPEVIDATEIGIKSDWFHRVLEVNGSFFYYQINHPQVQTIQNGLVAIANAGEAEVKGLDLDTQYKITSNLRADIGAEYLDAHYTSYQNAPFIIPNPVFPFGNNNTVAGNATGNELVRAPRYSVNAGLRYGLDTSAGDFKFVANYAWNSGFYWDPDNIWRQRSYGLLNASVRYMLPGNDKLELQIWGKNITGTKYVNSDLEQAGIPGTRTYPGAPATVGVQVTYKLGG